MGPSNSDRIIYLYCPTLDLFFSGANNTSFTISTGSISSSTYYQEVLTINSNTGLISWKNFRDYNGYFNYLLFN